MSRDRKTQAGIGRRRLIQTAGATGLLLTAGCLGDDDPDPDDDDGDPGDDGADDGDDDDDGRTDDGNGIVEGDPITGATTRFPNEFEWNTEGTGEVPDHHVQAWVYGAFAVRDAENNWQMVLGDDWEIPSTLQPGDEVTLTLKDGLEYHDGSPLDAAALADDASVRLGMESHITRHFSEVEVENDLTLRLTADEAAADGIAMNAISGLNGQYGTPRTADLAEGFREAEDDEEIEELQADLVSQSWDEPNGAGPWAYEEASSDRLLLRHHEAFPYNTDISHLEVRYVGDQLQRAVETGQLDFAQDREGWTLEERNLPLDRDPEVRTFRAGEGWSLLFDVRTEIWGNRAVRQAMAHVIDRNAAVQDQLPGTTSDEDREMVRDVSVPPSLSLMPREQEERFLGDLRGDLETYSGYNEAEAVALLEAEGFSRDDGDWYTPDGERWETSIRAGPAFQPFAQSVSNQLNRFGIASEMDAMEGGAFWDAQLSSDEPFEITIGLFGVDDHPFPVYDRLTGLDQRISYTDEVWGQDVGEEDPHIVVDLPPVGDPDGPEEEFDLTEAVDELERTSEDDAHELVQQIAWYNTVHVQTIPFTLVQIYNMITHDDWDWPDEDSPYNRGLDGYEGATAWMLGEIRRG